MSRGLSDFIGEYQVARQIDDHRAQSVGSFEGRAGIVVTSQGALYQEQGTLSLAGQSFEAERSYIWRQDGPRIFVTFEDGRDFHDFDPVEGGQATRHLCGADWYQGGYDFSQWPRWSLTWDVTGPRKDYRSRTWMIPFS